MLFLEAAEKRAQEIAAVGRSPARAVSRLKKGSGTPEPFMPADFPNAARTARRGR